MAKVKKEYDAEGVKLTMRTRDYLADMSGPWRSASWATWWVR